MLRAVVAWLRAPAFSSANSEHTQAELRVIEIDAERQGGAASRGSPPPVRAPRQLARLTSDSSGREYVYDLGETLGDSESSTAVVYAGWVGDVGGVEVAVKVEEPNSQIKNDQMVWNKLLEHEQGGFRGLAKFFDYVPAYKKRTQCFMVTERLGPSLDALRNGSRRFAASAIPAVAHQALCMLREVHVRGFVHRDVKPANFLVGISNREQTLHLVDFGTSEPYLPLIQKQDRSGTLSYLPRGALLKQPLSRRDDLEGLCYTLLSLMAGSLPWQAEAIAANKLKGKKYEAANINLGNSRESAALKLAYELQPPNVSIMVVALLEYVYGLSPNEDPDYDLLLRHCSDASANAASNIGGQMTVGFMPLPDLSLLVTTQNKADPGLRFENSAEIPTEDGGHSNPRGQPLGDSWICSGAQDLEELGEMTYRDLQRVAKQVGVPANQNRVRLEAALAREREV